MDSKCFSILFTNALKIRKYTSSSNINKLAPNSIYDFKPFDIAISKEVFTACIEYFELDGTEFSSIDDMPGEQYNSALNKKNRMLSEFRNVSPTVNVGINSISIRTSATLQKNMEVLLSSAIITLLTRNYMDSALLQTDIEFYSNLTAALAIEPEDLVKGFLNESLPEVTTNLINTYFSKLVANGSKYPDLPSLTKKPTLNTLTAYRHYNRVTDLFRVLESSRTIDAVKAFISDTDISSLLGPRSKCSVSADQELILIYAFPFTVELSWKIMLAANSNLPSSVLVTKNSLRSDLLLDSPVYHNRLSTEELATTCMYKDLYEFLDFIPVEERTQVIESKLREIADSSYSWNPSAELYELMNRDTLPFHIYLQIMKTAILEYKHSLKTLLSY
jgi:hypothetical protein